MNKSLLIAILLLFPFSLLYAEADFSVKNKKDSSVNAVFTATGISIKELKKGRAGKVLVKMENSDIRKIIVASLNESYIVPGTKLQLLDFLDEQQRLADLLHENGYQLIVPEDIRFRIDETGKQKNIMIQFDDEIASKKLAPVFIRKTIILQNLISSKAMLVDIPVENYGNALLYHTGKNSVELAPALTQIYENNELFSLDKELSMKLALLQLKGVSTVDISYLPVASSEEPEVDCVVYLTTALFSKK